MQVPLAGVLKPSHMIIRDKQQNSILLVIRGTHSLKVRGAGTASPLLAGYTLPDMENALQVSGLQWLHGGRAHV